MANNVKFIRVHGRIVPLRQKTGQAPAKHAAPAKPQSKKPFMTKTKAVFLAAAVGIGVFLIARKFRMSKNLKLAELQKAVNKAGPSGFGVVTDVPRAQTAANRTFEKMMGLKHNSYDMKGGVVLNRGLDAHDFYEPAHTINPHSFASLLDSKRANTSIINPKAMPKQKLFEKALDKVKGRGKRLGEIYPEFVIKKEASAMNKLENFANEKTIMLKKNLYHFRNPEKYVIQEKLNLKAEYRAHMLNGEVFGISHRRIPNAKLRGIWDKYIPGGGGGSFIPVVNPAERLRIKKLVTENVKLGKLGKNESVFAAFDIGKTDAGLKIIEANTAPGTFAMNPFVSRRFKELASGRMSRARAGALGVGAGGATYTIAAPGEPKRKATKKKTKK